MRHWKPLLVLAVVHVAAFGRLIFADADGVPYRVIPWDFRSTGAPWLIYGWDVLRTGELPLWCPYAGAGTPFFANPQTQLYGPISLLLGPIFGYSYRVAQLHCVLLILIGGIGAYALAYGIWRSRIPALLSAVCYQLSPLLFAHLGHMTILSAYAFAPWLFFSIVLAVAGQSRAALPLLSFVVYAVLTTGYLGVALMLFLWAIGATCALLLRRPASPRARLLLLGKHAGAWLLGAGLAAVNWLPFLLTRDEMTRGQAMTPDAALDATHSLSPKLLWNLLYSFTLTSPLPGVDVDIAMRGLYLSGVALALVALCVVFVRGFMTNALLVAGIGGLLMALGGNFFGRVTLHLLIPLFNFSRFPVADSSFLLVLALALLAGGGALVLQREEELPLRFLRRAFAALGVFYLLSFAVLPFVYGTYVDNVFSTLSFEALCMLLAMLVLVRYRGKTQAALLAAIALLETGYGLNANFEPAGAPVGDEQRVIFSGLPAVGFRVPAAGEARRGEAVNLSAESSNEAYVLRAFHINDYNPLRSKRLEWLVSLGFGPWLESGPRVTALPLGARPKAFDEFESKARDVDYSIAAYKPNEARYAVNLKDAALLVFNEVYFPGWKASVDGSVTPVGAIASGLRAVRVDAGRHEVRMWFQPSSFYISLTLSILSLVGFLAWIAFLVVRVRNESPVSEAFSPLGLEFLGGETARAGSALE